MQNADIAIIGGEKDFNLLRLASYVSNKTELKMNLLLFGESENNSFHFDINNRKLYVNDEEFACKSLFIRKDIFSYNESQNIKDKVTAENWFNAFSAWILANPKLKVLNREFYTRPYFHKSNDLFLAQKHNLPIPKTYISNSTSNINRILNKRDLIYKPLKGGEHTKKLDGKFDENAYKERIFVDPCFFQEELSYPELRVFNISGKLISFEISSSELDYRENRSSAKISRIQEIPEYISRNLINLNNDLNLDYSAADFKYSPEDGEFKFLEINSNPMFNSFDKISDFLICKEIINYLAS